MSHCELLKLFNLYKDKNGCVNKDNIKVILSVIKIDLDDSQLKINYTFMDFIDYLKNHVVLAYKPNMITKKSLTDRLTKDFDDQTCKLIVDDIFKDTKSTRVSIDGIKKYATDLN